MMKKETVKKRESRISVFFSDFTITKRNKRRLLVTLGIGILFTIVLLLTSNTEILWLFFIPPAAIFTFFPIGIFLVISDKNPVRNILIMIAIILVGVFFKKMHWPGASLIFTVTLVTFGCGYFFLALKNFFSIRENTYLRIVSTMSAFFISLMSTGMVFKMQHWPGGNLLLTISLVPSLIFTMLVLVTLPGSGYIRWKKQNKLMFTRKLLIPWVFYLLVAAVTMLLPKDFSGKLFVSSPDKDNPFRMEQYDVEQVDGLETDQ